VSSPESNHLCNRAPVVEVTYHPTSDRTPLEAIVLGLTEASDVEPTEFPPLQQSIDLDAINQLFAGDSRGANRDAVLSFTVENWLVFVRADGTIRICDRRQPMQPAPVFDAAIAETPR
jgi:hypothetical protein